MISGFQCGECKIVFSDPDECMIHAFREHPRKQENEDSNDEDQLEYRPL